MSIPDADQNTGGWRVGTWLRGKYRLDRVIGVGGAATVYAATHRNKKRVAVKVLRSEYSMNANLRARFLREGYVANSVEHPGAVTVLDDDIAEDGSAFLVMELLEGETLDTIRVTQGRLSANEALCIADQVLDTLIAAHAKNVVHRDLKPGNLFVALGGEVKVLDFGIARLRENGAASTTQTGISMGTPAFMAPEQAMGMASRVDGQSDLWSVGATLFELLTGEYVHVGETPQHVVMLSATVPARSVAKLLPDLPSQVVSIVNRALQFEKKNRWESAADMKVAVRDASFALFGHAPSPTFLAHLPKRLPVSDQQLGISATEAALPTPIFDTQSRRDASPSSSAAPLGVGTTAEPVSSAPQPKPRRSRLGLASLVVGGLAATLAAVAYVAVIRARPVATAREIATVSASPPPAAIPAAAVPSAVPPLPSAADPVASAAPLATTAPKRSPTAAPISSPGTAAPKLSPSPLDFDHQ